jgi:isobutyryl-CoA mutase
VDLVDLPVYVMTSEYGAASQLEKIDMLDFAEIVVLNKFEKRGAEDALRDVRKQWKRNRKAFQPRGRGRARLPDHRQPVQRSGRQPACSSALCEKIVARCGLEKRKTGLRRTLPVSSDHGALIPSRRARYLAEIAENGRRANERSRRPPPEAASLAWACWRALDGTGSRRDPRRWNPIPAEAVAGDDALAGPASPL